MTLRIHRQFIATIAAIAIAITGFSAAPARAGDDELAAALAVILGLAVVGTAINKRKDEKKARQQAHTYQPRAKPRHVQPQHGHIQPRPLPRQVDRRLLPQRCLFNLETERGRNIQGFGQRCLNRHYNFTNTLPQQCHRRVWTRNGLGHAYGARCLNKHGYQLARR
ncbi:hypothetical protein [uncultured Tateyamaria sp.]|uniref:hypothetical protein n=1 Tax=uncultured Tateyamaria sp. TaxID=455651 RepID=UPI0026320C9F|nr:hypothetical protein [uncultured Tateyamaria sp.]